MVFEIDYKRIQSYFVWYFFMSWYCGHVLRFCVFNCLFIGHTAVPFPLPAVCAGLCYWLIESVFCAAALPWRLVLAHTHCSRTNENTPRHLPKRDTPSPSPCPSTLVALSLFTLFVSFLFLPSCPHRSLFCSPTPPPCLSPILCFFFLSLTFLIHFSLSFCVQRLHFYHSCFLPFSLLLPASLHPE